MGPIEAKFIINDLIYGPDLDERQTEALEIARDAIDTRDNYGDLEGYKFSYDHDPETKCSICGAGGPVVRILYTRSTRYRDKSGSSRQEELKLCHYCRRDLLITLKKAWRV